MTSFLDKLMSAVKSWIACPDTQVNTAVSMLNLEVTIISP